MVWFVEESILYIDAKLWIRVVANLQHERAAKHWKRPGLLKNWAAQANTRHFTSCQWLNLFYFSMNSDCGHHLQLLQCFVNVSSQLDCAFVTFRPLWRLFKSVAKFPSTFLFEILQNNQALWPVAQQRHRGQVYTLSGGWGHPSFLFFTSCSPFLHPWLQNRVSQKNQKSEFCFATKPTGFHRLDEPSEKISAL